MSAKISLALGGARKPPPTTGIRRPHEALHDHEEDGQEHGARQTVSHFDHSAGGAIDAARPKEKREPLIIAPQANRDWREASQRNKRRKIEDVRFQGEVDEKMVDVEGKKPGFGLNVPRKAEELEEVEMDGLVNGHAEAGDVERAQQNGDSEALQEAETDDQRALAALLGKESNKRELTVPAMTEEEAFERDVSSAPPIPTLADYDRIPVEDFGAALLRGMGWKEGEGIGSERGKKVEKTQLPKRRPALLGIGAKEEAAVAQELGAWGRGAKGTKGGTDAGVGYQPVLLRDKKTGELFTEDELEKKKAEDERRKYELEFEEREKRKEDRRQEDRRRDRDGERKRDRSRDRDRRKYDSDDEYHQRKKEERRRREREGKDSDLERSRRYDSDRDRHRERHRDHRR